MKRDAKQAALKAAATRLNMTLEEYLNVPIGSKRCSTCKEIKPAIEEMFVHSKGTADGFRAKCKTCLHAQKKVHYTENKEAIRKNQAVYRKENMPKLLAYNSAWQRKKNRDLRREMVKVYGGCCACCGETEPLFLELDHIENDGAAHRKEMGNQLVILMWLKKNNWPTDRFQLLCANCNQGKNRNGGVCPHKHEKDL